MSDAVRVALIGTGAIALANHVPGFGYAPGARLTALCDTSPAALENANRVTGVNVACSDWREVLARDDVDAVVIATPNNLHAPITIAAARAKKHILCEKPISMNLAEALEMYRAAESAGVRHMTAFTYRFVPAMAYMAHLVHSGYIGQPYHFRASRFQDWGHRPLGWRQVKKLAATGEMGDMLSHRIDYGHYLLGRVKRVVARTRLFIENRSGHMADVDDWVAMIGEFDNGATGLWESSKLASGRGEGGRSQDYCEVNGSEGSLVYFLGRPLELQAGRKGAAGLETIAVPEPFLKHRASSRDAQGGDPLVTFRYDQDAEFIEAIRQGRPCSPSLRDGAAVQAVMEAALESDRRGCWVEVAEVS